MWQIPWQQHSSHPHSTTVPSHRSMLTHILSYIPQLHCIAFYLEFQSFLNLTPLTRHTPGNMRLLNEPLLIALVTTAAAWPALTSPSSLGLHIRAPNLGSLFNKLTHRQDGGDSIVLLPGDTGYITDSAATLTTSSSLSFPISSHKHNTTS